MKSRPLFASIAVAGLAVGAIPLVTSHFAGAPTEHPVDFNRDIRPIFNQHCVSCHGGVKKQGGVSFTYLDEALSKGKSGRPTVLPGDPEASELIARITSRDPQVRMPLHAPPLQPQQIDMLKRWIREGAHWENFWAFVPPKRSPVPTVREIQWPRQTLDRFILAKLERQGLKPSPEATKAQLLRRVSFDLVGLPPTPQELAAFMADTSADAFEREVDRLLASPHFGERWASMWLDLARYSDSRGYEKDLDRPMWPYRDWIINAFNSNTPYDRFVITQLAGDLLPNATLDDRIATAFQRQTPANDEGGTDDEEYRLVAVMDRVATTWSVLNGVTMNCVQCHSHPYDPIKHNEYYKFLAFYNTSQDSDRFDDAPVLRIPKEVSLRGEFQRVEQRKSQLLREVIKAGRSLNEESSWRPLPVTTALVDERLAAEGYLENVRAIEKSGVFHEAAIKTLLDEVDKYRASKLRDSLQTPASSLLKIDHGEVKSVGTVPQRAVYQLLTEDVPQEITALRIEVPPMNPNEAIRNPEDCFMVDRVDVSVVFPDAGEKKVTFSYFAHDTEEGLQDDLRPVVDNGLYSDAVFALDRPAEGGVGAFSANPKLYQKRWIIAIPEQPMRLEQGSRLKVQLWQTGSVDDKPANVRRVRFDTTQDERWTAFARSDQLRGKLAELGRMEQWFASVPGTPLPVMEEQPAIERRQTFEFERGNFLDKIGNPLTPDVPKLFPGLPRDKPRNRLTMAQWFFSPDQPLTARVAVNRFWEQVFGTGIVETLEDFGSAGELPSHRRLLDWLALHFQNDLHWNMKALLRELVTSSTYRQSAVATPELVARDPRNRWLSRGPQQRLTAEMVRDQAILAGGLLNPSVGGPSVMPPQPKGVWMTVYNVQKWIDATGPDRYRRALYTYLKRSALYPSFVTFDAADHVTSLARRIPTNTPLQALVTLNDPVYYEAAEGLGRQLKVIHGTTERLNEGARRVLSRDLTADEQAKLETLYRDVLMRPPDPPGTRGSRSSDDPEMVALTVVSAVLLNLDAALTR